ncbi:MAG: hypothetical protein Q8Q78_00370 [Hydrogenophaga sp.]|nr:hypothetical protein [Hydrogenophaga sp.]
MTTSPRHFVQTGGALREELISIIGDAATTDHVIFEWCSRAAVLGNSPADFLTGPDPETDGQRSKKLQGVLTHIDALTSSLDRRTSWLIACASPGFFDGPEVAEETETRLAVLVRELDRLGADVRRAERAIPAPQKGRQLHPSPRLVLLISLVADLQDAGIPFSAAENSKMVKAVRIFWSAVDFDGDPRDLLRTLHKRRGRKSSTSV